MALSFILQGYVYSLPLELLFSNYPEEGKMEMLIRYIDDDDAIWIFGYPFMNQFLTIFNLEDNHVGMKKLKKTALPIVNLRKDWDIWHSNKEGLRNTSKIIAIIFLILIILGLAFFEYRFIRRRMELKNQKIELNEESPNNNKIY